MPHALAWLLLAALPARAAAQGGGPGSYQDAPAGGEEARRLESSRYSRLAGDSLNVPDIDAAIRNAQLAIEAYPENRVAHNIQAQAYNLTKRYDLAEQAARRSLGIGADGNAAAYENLALALLHQGKLGEAKEAASRAIELNNKSALAYALRAFANEALGNPLAAMDDIRIAARHDSDTFGAHAQAAAQGQRMFDRGGEQAGPAFSVPFGDVIPLGPAALAGASLFLVLCAGTGIYLWRRPGEEQDVLRVAARPSWTRSQASLLAGKYQLTRVIGKGGMGEVWEGHDQSLGRPVAVKKMSAALGALGPKARDFYLKEAKTLASVHHPHIVDIYETLDLPDGMFLVFELVTGKTVQQILVEGKRLPLARAREILRPVCEALDYAHSRGIVHRDLKPSNIMVTDEGFVKVMDFGIARQTETELPPESAALNAALDRPSDGSGLKLLRTQTIGGTPAYMAPEAEQGIVSSGSDVYSLGVCLYEMLTGDLPFGIHGGFAKHELNYVRATSKVPELGAPVDALIDAALQPRLEARIPTPREFLTRLEKLPAPVPTRG